MNMYISTMTLTPQPSIFVSLCFFLVSIPLCKCIHIFFFCKFIILKPYIIAAVTVEGRLKKHDN